LGLSVLQAVGMGAFRHSCGCCLSYFVFCCKVSHFLSYRCC